jgi:hypothetical protein
MVELYQDYEKTNSDPPHLPSALNNLPGQFHDRGRSSTPNCFSCVTSQYISVWHADCPNKWSAASPLHGLPEVIMEKNKQRAIGILMVLGSILVLVATWDIAEKPARTGEVN